MQPARSQFRRGADILELCDLLSGRELSEQEIAERLGRHYRHVREDLGHLVITGQLLKTCGIARRPAHYRLPGRQENEE